MTKGERIKSIQNSIIDGRIPNIKKALEFQRDESGRGRGQIESESDSIDESDHQLMIN
jgi:hypothetical protein